MAVRSILTSEVGYHHVDQQRPNLPLCRYDSATNLGFEWRLEGDKTFPRVYYCYVFRLNQDVANHALENVRGRLMRRAC